MRIPIQNPFGWIGEVVGTGADYIEDELVPDTSRGEGRPHPPQTKPKVKPKKRKPKPKAKTKKPVGGPAPSFIPTATAAPSFSTGVDIAQLAAAAGVDPRVFAGLRPNVGNLIPLSLARGGARTMGGSEIERLIQSIVGDQYDRQTSLMQSERDRTLAQNKQNLGQIRRWYDQVLGSQGVAAQRDEAFGRAAVESAEDSTRAIIGALGGEANEGSYAVGQAGNQNVGNINAIGAIQNQYNADMAPLLEGEAAGQLTREQAMGGERLRDLSMRLQELQSQRGSQEAEMRFNVWQSNNEILDRRLQNEMAIRQANTGLRQQRFANQMGLRQAIIAAQAASAGGVMDAAQFAQEEAKIAQGSAEKAADRQYRAALEAAKEAGRNYRAQLSAAGGATSSGPKAYYAASQSAKKSAFNDILGSLSDTEMEPQQALQVATAVVRSYGWSVKNAAVQGLLRAAMREAGYDI